MREAAVDAALAAAALIAVLVVAAWTGTPARPPALAAGVAGALVVEFALGRRRQAVRRAWERPAVKIVAVGAFLAALAAATAAVPAVGLSLLAGGLVGYLGLLAGVAVGRLL
jgi:hypothetical protein